MSSRSNSKSSSPKRKGKGKKQEKSSSQSPEKESSKRRERKSSIGDVPRIDRMLYVSQLSGKQEIDYLTNKIRNIFQEKCTVISVEVRRSFTKQYSYAFVQIKEASLVPDLIKEFDGSKLDGQRIIVEKKRPSIMNRGNRSPPKGTGQGCYKCGQLGHFARQCQDRGEEHPKKELSKHKRTRKDRESSEESEERPRRRKQNNHSRTRSKKYDKKKKQISDSSSPDSSSSSSTSSVSSSSSESRYRRHKKRDSRHKDRKRRDRRREKAKRQSSSSSSE